VGAVRHENVGWLKTSQVNRHDGVFGTLQGWLQAFVKVNPVTALSEAERALLTGGPAAAPVVKSLLWALAIFVVFAPLAVRVYRRKT
jgi:oleandomycin transport system permease protein